VNTIMNLCIGTCKPTHQGKITDKWGVNRTVQNMRQTSRTCVRRNTTVETLRSLLAYAVTAGVGVHKAQLLNRFLFAH
jgi:hypothetical protein